MANEMNETTVTMELVYDGVKTTLTRVIANVGIEQGVEALKKQVDLLGIASGGLEQPE